MQLEEVALEVVDGAAAVDGVVLEAAPVWVVPVEVAVVLVAVTVVIFYVVAAVDVFNTEKKLAYSATLGIATQTEDKCTI